MVQLKKITNIHVSEFELIHCPKNRLSMRKWRFEKKILSQHSFVAIQFCYTELFKPIMNSSYEEELMNYKSRTLFVQEIQISTYEAI